MEEMNVNNVAEEAVEMVQEARTSNGMLGAVLGVVTAAGAGAFVWFKTKPQREAKRNAKQIERLRKAGYTVIEPEADDVNSEDFESEEK